MRRWSLVVLAAAVAWTPAAARAADRPDEYLMPIESYTTAKGRTLATAHKPELLRLYDHIYYCLPWVGVAKNGIGFPRRKGAEADDRYFSVWIDVDQTDDGGFAALSRDRRASAMLSRYGVDLLRRMTTLTDVGSDANLFGYSIILSWLKPGGGRNPSKETLAVFVDKGALTDYLARRLPGEDFVSRVRYLMFDGKEQIDSIRLEVWEDSFNSTYKLKNYEPPKEKKC
jgi:hypothetical protein